MLRQNRSRFTPVFCWKFSRCFSGVATLMRMELVDADPTSCALQQNRGMRIENEALTMEK